VPPRRLLALVLSLATLAACQGRATPNPARDAALSDTLTALIVRAYDFSKPGFVARATSLYAPTGLVISAAAGRVTTTRAAVEQSITSFWERVGQNMQQPKFLIRQRHATSLGPDAAVLTIAYTIPHLTPEGRPHTLGGAWTALFVRRDDRWVIVQEHLSDLPPQRDSTAMAMPMP
jgi:hypothetical protein